MSPKVKTGEQGRCIDCIHAHMRGDFNSPIERKPFCTIIGSVAGLRNREDVCYLEHEGTYKYQLRPFIVKPTTNLRWVNSIGIYGQKTVEVKSMAAFSTYVLQQWWENEAGEGVWRNVPHIYDNLNNTPAKQIELPWPSEAGEDQQG